MLSVNALSSIDKARKIIIQWIFLGWRLCCWLSRIRCLLSVVGSFFLDWLNNCKYNINCWFYITINDIKMDSVRNPIAINEPKGQPNDHLSGMCIISGIAQWFKEISINWMRIPKTLDKSFINLDNFEC